jgi:hypothetical protein
MKTYEVDPKELNTIKVLPPPSLDSEAQIIFKVNAVTLHGNKIVVAGLDATGKGVAKIILYNNTKE